MLICPNLSNKDVAREFNELKSALMAADPKHGEAMAYLVWSLNNGNAIDKAPNGAESLLFNSLVDYYEGNRSKAIVAKAKTYSTNFLKWFGNWTGEEDALPEYERSEVSKVVDENGEPLVVWHGSPNEDILEFDKNKIGSTTDPGVMGKGFYFTPKTSYAKRYGKNLYPAFLNIKKPVTNVAISDIIGRSYDELKRDPQKAYNNMYERMIKRGKTVEQATASANRHKEAIINANENFEKLLQEGYDGGIFLERTTNQIKPSEEQIVVPNPNQIKHIDNRDGEYTGPNIYHNISTSQEDEELKQISLIFDRFPELDEVGTPEQYYWYIQSIFPNSKDKRIYWHGSDADFSDGLRSAKKSRGSGAPETKKRNDFYLARQAWTVLLYVSYVNRRSIDKNGYAHWNKLWWEFKEIMANGRRQNNDWKDIVINEKNIRQAIPNKAGIFNRDEGGENGKWLRERKADYGYENKSDKLFFEEILGVNWGEDTFNTWTRRNAMLFKLLLKSGEKGIYPAVLDVNKPIRETGQDTYYEEHRGLMTKADKEGYDTILSENADNEFNSDIAVVLNVNENRLHFLGTKSDIEQFKKFVKEHQYDYTEQEYIEPNISEPFSPYPEYDEETKLMFLRINVLQKEFNDLKNKRLELNKKLQEAKCDTISKKIITIGDGKIKFVEKPNHFLKIDNDTNIFGLVSTNIWFDGDTVSTALLFPSKHIMNPANNYYRIDNSIRENTNRIVYELLSVLKNHGKNVIYSPWQIKTAGIISEPDNAGMLILRMSKLLGIKLSDFVTFEETVIDDDTPFGKRQIVYYRIVFNIDTMLNRLNIVGHNKEIYNIIDKTYQLKPISKNNDLLIKALLTEEKDIDERQSQIQKEIRDINEGLYKKEQENSDLPFNVTQGSLIWLVKKYINEGRSKLDLQYILNEINYTNGSKIKINWSNFEVYGELLSGKDNIKRTNDDNKERIKVIVDYLNEKFGNKLQVEYIDEDIWLRDSRLYNGSNSCVIGDVIYLRKSRMTTEIAAEEMLHTLVHGMKHGNNELGNKELFNNLFEKAKQQFPYLWQEILSVYKYNHDEELVTLVLARYFNRDFDKHDTYKLEDLINKFKNWFIKLFKDLLEEFAGNYYTTVGNINPLVDFLDISDMLLAKNLKFDILTIPEIHKENLYNKTSHVYSEDQILHNISARQQAAEAEAKRILVRMNVLYREYEKIKSKTPSLERIANNIFETLNELKQHMDVSSIGIALQQARLTLGQYDPTTNGPALMSKSNVYLYLYDKEQQGFSGVTPNQLVDMYRNSIKFYQDLINDIPTDREIDLSRADKDAIEELKTLISTYIMPLWTDAIVKVGDDIVDQQVDLEVEANDQDKEDMKRVAKDWLHKNIMYGDLNAVSSYIYNYSYSSNPIIKQAFHLILHAEQLTLEEMHHIAPELIKAYQDANSGIRSVTPGWQSMMMEFDDEGKPTGYFIRALNYGQYEKDLKNFRKELNNEFLDKYKFTYVTDDTGTIVNSLTGEYAEDEEWGPNGEMPKYIEYQRAIEMFKGPRVFRRYTTDYYLERLTRPYDGTIDPLDPMFKDTRFNHGLSPKTLKRYNYYHSNINYYLNKCQDPDTGLIYPERLSKDDRFSLDRWNQRFDDFKSIFNPDGSYKSGEDLKMAYEVRAWLKWIGQKTDSKRYQDLFNDEMTRLYQEGMSSGDMSKYNTFMRYNASVGINPDYVKQTIGSFRSDRSETDLSHKALLLRKALQDMVKSPLQYSRKLTEMESNPLFWLHCKSSDLAIDDAKKPNDSGWAPGQVETFLESFYDREILYVNPNGNYIDENGNAVSPNTTLAKSLEEAGKLQTFRQHLINVYTNQALTTGFVNGLIDESTGLHIDFSGMSLNDIRTLIINLLSYRRRIFHKDGSITEEYAPLSIFSMLTPTKETFFNTRTGKTERTIVYLGEGRFKESYSTFSTSKLDFDPNEGVSEKPNATFDAGRYDNSEAYNEVVKNSAVKNLYDKLILTMIDSLDIYSTNRKFNYKLPQINARTTSLFSRLIKRGYTEKSLSAIWNSMNNIEENDDGMRTKDDYFVGVDGEIANDVPLKFIRNLKNPEDISTDLVSSVIMFADMAINYKNKQAIDDVLKILRYNMEDATRTTNKKKYIWFGENIKSNEQSIKMFDSMMNSHMYGNQWVGKNKEGGPSRAKIATFKTVDAFLSLESGAMLGLNMFSMSVGFADSLTRIFSESLAGKYMTPGDCLFALGKCLWYTPACIKNMFNPLANNKLTALMQMNGISKGVYGIYTKADWGKGRKFLSNLLMGGWSMLDWMANALLMTAFYHNIRFYDGGIVPTGFYSKYELQQEFLKAGHTKAEANLAHDGWSIFPPGFNTNTHKKYTVTGTNQSWLINKNSNTSNKQTVIHGATLWDAYYFKDGEAYVRPEFEPYVTLKIKTRVATKTKKRGALYNGMNPDNDVPQWKRDVIGRLVGALRSWIFLQFQHLFAGGTDNVAREFEDVDVYETTSSGTRKKTKSKKVKLTDELRSRRFAWDYESGTPLDQIIVGIGRSIRTLFKKIISWCKFLKPGAKFSEVEKYAVKDAIIFLAMLSLMMVGWTYVHDWAREVPAPKNRQEAGPMSMLNPVDYYDYIKDYYIPREYWRLGADDIYFRTVEAKISNIDPFLVSDIVNAATALKSGLDDQISLIGLGMDIATGDEDINTELKQGAYKYYTKGERTMYRAVGPIKNMHTFLTYEGATNNLRWYTNKFGKFYRFAGYDFKKKDNDKNKQSSNFRLSGGNFSGGNLVGGNLSGGNLSGGGF